MGHGPTFLGVTWRHRSRDCWVPDMQFPIDDPLKPSLYLASLLKYYVSNIYYLAKHIHIENAFIIFVLAAKLGVTPFCNVVLVAVPRHVVWALNRHNECTGLVTAVLAANELLNCFVTKGPITCLCTPRALFSPVFLQSCSVIHESGSYNSFQRYGHSKFSKMAASRHLGLGPNGSSVIWSVVLENAALEQTGSGSVDPLPRYGRFQNAMSVGRSVVGPQYIHCSHVRSARGVKNLAVYNTV